MLARDGAARAESHQLIRSLEIGIIYERWCWWLCGDDGEDGEDDNGSDEGVEGKGDGVLNQKNIVNFELIFYQQGQR